MSSGKAWARGIAPDAANRDPYDFYPTPANAVYPLLAEEQFTGTIWEPACGNGAISRVLERAGYNVTSADLIDRGYGQGGIDFLTDHTTVADNIITNPPYDKRILTRFVEHALNRVPGKVAMLLRLAWLEGKGRRHLVNRLSRVYVFSGRVLLYRRGEMPKNDKNKGMIAFAWFVWDPAHTGPTELHTIMPMDTLP